MDWLKVFFGKFAIWFVLAAFVAGAGAGAYATYEVQTGKQAKADLKRALDDAAALAALETHYSQEAAKLEAALAANQKTAATLNQRLKNEIAKNSAYRSCIVPADGVRILQDAAATD